MTFIVFTPISQGSFSTSDPYLDLDSARAETPPGGHVEQLTETGSVIVFRN